MYSRSLDNHSCALNNDSGIIREYFRVSKTAVDEFKVKPQNIYNMDEKGFLLGLIQRSVRATGEDGVPTATRTTGGVFGASVVDVLKPEFSLSHPKHYSDGQTRSPRPQ